MRILSRAGRQVTAACQWLGPRRLLPGPPPHTHPHPTHLEGEGGDPKVRAGKSLIGAQRHHAGVRHPRPLLARPVLIQDLRSCACKHARVRACARARMRLCGWLRGGRTGSVRKPARLRVVQCIKVQGFWRASEVRHCHPCTGSESLNLPVTMQVHNAQIIIVGPPFFRPPHQDVADRLSDQAEGRGQATLAAADDQDVVHMLPCDARRREGKKAAVGQQPWQRYITKGS